MIKVFHIMKLFNLEEKKLIAEYWKLVLKKNSINTLVLLAIKHRPSSYDKI